MARPGTIREEWEGYRDATFEARYRGEGPVNPQSIFYSGALCLLELLTREDFANPPDPRMYAWIARIRDELLAFHESGR